MRTRCLAPLALAFLALALPAGAHAVTYKPQGKPVPYEGFHAKFPSGMQLVVYEMPSVDRFALTVSYGSGQVDDPAGKEGVSHLLEHLAFRSVPGWTGGVTVWDYLTRGGYRFNAFTDQDRTDYWIKGKPAELRVALLLEAARMRDPLAGVTEDDLAVERDVVVSEYRERFETVGHGWEMKWVLQEAYRGQAFGRPHQVPETIRSITLADAAAFAQQHYRPENAVIVVISPRKAKEVAALVADLFGELAIPAAGIKQEPRAQAAVPLPAPSQKAPVTHAAPVRTPVVWVAWPVPGAREKRDPQGWAAATAISQWFSTLINAAYRWRAVGLVADQAAGFTSWNGAGLVWIRVQLGPGGDVDKVVEAIKTAAMKVRMENTTDISRYVRDDLLMQSYLSLENIDGSEVARFLRATGQADYLQSWQKLVAVQLKTDASNYAAEFLKRERAVVVLIQPDKNELARSLVAATPRGEQVDQASEVTGVADVSQPGAPGLARAERRVLTNGLEVVVSQRGSLPVAELQLLIRTQPGGTAQAPAGLGDLALRSNFEVLSARDMWLVAGRSDTKTGTEEVLRTTRGSSANLDALLSAMGSWASDQEARYLDDAREEGKALYATFENEHFYRAQGLLRAGLYPGHPYAEQTRSATLAKVGQRDADRWLSSEIRPERATLVLVSDQAPTPELWAAIEGHMGGWRKGSTPRTSAAPPPLPAGRKVLLLDRPGASQAVLYVGARAPARRERDDAAMAALRWTIDQRLNTRLRVEEGVSYGLQSAFEDEQAAGALVTAVAVDRDAAGQSLKTVLEASQALADKPLDVAQVNAAKLVVAREYAYRYDTVGEVANALVDAARHGLPPDHHDQLAASIAGLTPARVQAAAASLSLGKEAIVVMGDAATVRPQLEKAGFAVELAPPRTN